MTLVIVMVDREVVVVMVMSEERRVPGEGEDDSGGSDGDVKSDVKVMVG